MPALSEAELPFKAEWALKNTRKHLDELEAFIKGQISIINGLSGKVGTPTSYPLEALLRRPYKDVGARDRGCYSREKERSPELALAAGKEAYEQSIPLVEANAAICAANAKLIVTLKTLIENAGISKTQRVTVRGRLKDEPAAWCSLGAGVQTYDVWPSLERQYKDFVDNCNRWATDLRTEAFKKQQAEDAERSKKEKAVAAETARITLCLKYAQDPMTQTMEDVFEAILSKDKYLLLADRLYRNREDWSDGPSYAESGLAGFTPVTDDDQKIVNEIQSLCEHWDGDGRVFRDCTWNYSVLFSMAAPDLVKDYESAKAYVEGE